MPNLYDAEAFDSIFEGSPSRRGASAEFKEDGSVHRTYYGSDGDKGDRFSWNEHSDGSVSEVHATDQESGEQY